MGGREQAMQASVGGESKHATLTNTAGCVFDDGLGDRCQKKRRSNSGSIRPTTRKSVVRSSSIAAALQLLHIYALLPIFSVDISWRGLDLPCNAVHPVLLLAWQLESIEIPGIAHWPLQNTFMYSIATVSSRQLCCSRHQPRICGTHPSNCNRRLRRRPQAVSRPLEACQQDDVLQVTTSDGSTAWLNVLQGWNEAEQSCQLLLKGQVLQLTSTLQCQMLGGFNLQGSRQLHTASRRPIAGR